MISKHIKAIPLLLILMALLGSLPDTASQAQAASVWVDPAVTAYLESHADAPVLVVLRARADLTDAAHRAQSWEARGRVVLEAHQSTALESQKSLKTFLMGQDIAFSDYWIVNALSLRANAALMEMLANREDVARVVLNAPFPVDLGQTLPAPPNPLSRNIEPNLQQINAPDLWSLGYTGTGIRIGIADTGVKWDHPALINTYAGWDGSSADHAYHWWDAVHDDSISGTSPNPCGINLSVPCDDYGHGTHVTGITTGDDGGSHQIGAAPGAEWIACRNMDSGYGTPETYIECYQFFLAPTDLNGLNPDPNQRPHIINNSFSCPVSEGCTAHDELHTAVEALRSAGIFMAVSAGNSGPACSTVNAPPALEPSVYTIGAVYGSDLITGFSSRGPVTVDGSGRIKPDLVAPGASILSSTYHDGYGYKSGTSMAGPHVAGGVAVLWSAIPELVRDIDATEALLNTSAHPLSCGENCCAPSSAGDIPNTVYGYGRLDLINAYAVYWGYQNYLPLVLSP
jgi:serine protease AprX